MNNPSNKIYCFSPSGRMISFDSANRALDFLQIQGFELLNTSVFKRSYQRFAGTDQERADEINSFCDKVHKIGPFIALATRGGYGLSRILPLIDWDKLGQAVQQGLKIVGHSDLTALHLALLKMTGQISYSGPMLSFDFGRDALIASEDFTYQHFKSIVLNGHLKLEVQQAQTYLQHSINIENATLWGGNLSMVQNLIGTQYFPGLYANSILFLEDVNEHPYRIERMLWQLLESGVLGQQKAILMGAFTDYQLTELDNSYDLSSAIGRIVSELQKRGSNTEVLLGLPFGHVINKVTLPIGSLVNLSADSKGFLLQGKL